MGLNKKTLVEQLTEELHLLLVRHEQERLELAQKSDKVESELFETQEQEQKDRHQQEIVNMTEQIEEAVENQEQIVTEKVSTPLLILIVLAFIFAFISVAGIGYFGAKQDETSYNVATNSQAIVAVDIKVDAVKTNVTQKITDVDIKLTQEITAVDKKVIALEKYKTDVTEPALAKLKEQVKHFVTDTNLTQAIAKVNKSVGDERKLALKKVHEINARDKAAQVVINSSYQDQILALKNRTAKMQKNQGMLFYEIWDLTYAECNDLKRSRGYGKKGCINKYISLKSLYPDIVIKPKKETALYFIILEIAAAK
jgi:hypothetical protein